MAKRKVRRKRTFSEKVILVLGIFIAISMILSLFVGLGTSVGQGGAPLAIEQAAGLIWLPWLF